MNPRDIALSSLLLFASQAVTASMDIRFVESAPKDWFSLTNSGDCTLDGVTMTVDLSGTVGKLIFDTTSKGEGVEVFQPFEIREGEIRLTSSDEVVDGDSRLSVLVERLAPGQSVSFTIDVDDTLPQSELGNIRVSGSEMAGGKVSLEFGEQADITGTFDSKASMILPSPECKTTADI